MMVRLLAILWLLGTFGPNATPAFQRTRTPRTRTPMQVLSLTAEPHRASRQGGGGLP